MKIVIIARKTGWVKEEPLERQDRYPMFAAAHCVSLVKNGNIQPQDITVISDIEKNKYLDFLKKIGVNVLINKQNFKYIDINFFHLFIYNEFKCYFYIY